MDIVYLDFHKAFNPVSHKILMEKLMKYGLGEQKGGIKLSEWLDLV